MGRKEDVLKDRIISEYGNYTTQKPLILQAFLCIVCIKCVLSFEIFQHS